MNLIASGPTPSVPQKCARRSLEKGRAAWHDIGEQILTNVNVAYHVLRKQIPWAATMISSWMEPPPSIPTTCAPRKPMHMGVQPDDTTMVYNYLRVATSPSMEHWKEKS